MEFKSDKDENVWQHIKELIDLLNDAGYVIETPDDNTPRWLRITSKNIVITTKKDAASKL